jgi:ParB-like chromosome segregation protein Spo0J
LAEEFRRRLDAGEVNRAELAQLYGLTRARITQILNLLRLHPRILEFLRGLTAGPHARLYTERSMRPLLPLQPDAQLREAVAHLRDFRTALSGRSTG